MLHAPKIGVTLKPTTGTTGSPTVRRNKHGLVIIDLEARHGALHGFGSIFKLVAEGLDRDFVAPGDLATRHPDDQQLLRFLETRRGNQIKHVLDELEGHLRQPPEERPVSVDLTWQEFDSQTSAAPPPQGGVVAVDAIRRARGWD